VRARGVVLLLAAHPQERARRVWGLRVPLGFVRLGLISRCALVVVLLLAVLGAAGPAAAVRPPNPDEGQAVRGASMVWLKTHLKPALVKKTRIIRISISSANHQYAKVDILIKRIGYNALLLRATSRGWNVLDFGPGGLDCTLAPAPVMKDLFGGCLLA
jgi:hypothetical protein